tara:strand:- start:1139 stop:2797 length:1659 start_codon:yes stop_codon:yes gene_type:complete
MKLFSKNSKIIPYLILFLIIVIFLFICYFYNYNEGFTCDNEKNNSDDLNKNTTLEEDVCYDCTKTLSDKNNEKFQYISCVFEKKHPPIDDVKINFVVRNNDGTFFNATGESIETITNENNNYNKNNETYNLVNDTAIIPQKNNMISEIKLNRTYNIDFEIKNLLQNEEEVVVNEEEANVNEEDVETKTNDESEVIENYTNNMTNIFHNIVDNKENSNSPSLWINNLTSKLMFKTSNDNSYEINYELPSDIYSNIHMEIKKNELLVTIQNDQLSGNPFTQNININNNNSRSDSQFYVSDPISEPAYVEIKNLTIKNINENVNDDNDENQNHVMKLNLGECKYQLSDLDHILIEQTNISNVENDVLTNNKDWTNEKPLGYIAGGIRNILYKSCDNEVIQNFNITSKLPNLLSPYKNDDDTLSLPTIYLIYNKNHYNNEEDIISYARNFYKDEIIQVIGTFSYGTTKPQILSYAQMLENSEYNENNVNQQNTPQCALSKHGCCPDGTTISEDIFGTNCKPIPCTFSQFGCCKDGVTTSSDLQGSNCPKFEYLPQN